MNVVIMGSSGMIGTGVLLECLADPGIEKILVINRKPIEIKDKKITEIIHDDFLDFSSIQDQFKGFDACFYCLGISSAGLNETQYTKITHDFTLSFAKLLLEQSPDVVFCFVSGTGTDSSEKGSTMWARVKGKTENDLLSLPFKDAYMFRPAYIQPLKGVRSRTPLYNYFYLFLKPLFFLFKSFKSFATDSVSLGKAMIQAARNGYEKKIIESKDINVLAERYG